MYVYIHICGGQLINAKRKETILIVHWYDWDISVEMKKITH